MATMADLPGTIMQIAFNFIAAIASGIRKFLNFIHLGPAPRDPYKSSVNRDFTLVVDNDEVLQIDGEYVLHDVLDIVCKHADARSLYNMTKVCRWWSVVASREIKNRVDPIQQWKGHPRAFSNLPSKIKAIPFASLFVYEHRSKDQLRASPRIDPVQDFNRAYRGHLLLTKYAEHLPNNAIVMRVKRYFTMKNGTFQSIEELRRVYRNLPGSSNIMGLFFPSNDPQLSFHAASIVDGMSGECIEDGVVNRLTEELGFNNCKYSKSTILMFSILSTNPNLRPVIDQLIKSQEKKGKEITFAGFYGTKIRETNDKRPCVCCGELRILLRISGPNVESWSTFIYFYAHREEINSKLSQLKKRVKSKRHCMGLVFAPKCSYRECNHLEHPCGNTIELMRKITLFFPYIRFTGLFLDYELETHRNAHNEFMCKKLSKDHFNDCLAEKQGSHLHVSIIIISYD